MHDAGLIPPDLLVAASHEADLLEHPYVGCEHLELARLRAEGRDSDYHALKATLPTGSGAAGGVHEADGQPSAIKVCLRRETRAGKPRATTKIAPYSFIDSQAVWITFRGPASATDRQAIRSGRLRQNRMLTIIAQRGAASV